MNEPAPSPNNTGRALAILATAAIGAGAITLLTMWGAFALLEQQTPVNDWETEGAWLAVLFVLAGCALVFGPLSFFAIVVAGSRRSGNLGQQALPYLGVLCFAPAVFISALVLWPYGSARGMAWPGPVATVAFAVAAAVLLAASVNKVSFRVVGTSVVGALAIVALCVAVMSATTDGYRRDLRRAELTSNGATLFLLPESASPTDWHVSSMWFWDPISSGQPGLGPVVELANGRYTEVELMRARDETNPICGWLREQQARCRVLLVTPGGRQVAHGMYGSFFYEITFDDHYIALSADEEIGDRDLALLADELQVANTDDWLDRLEAFEKSGDS